MLKIYPNQIETEGNYTLRVKLKESTTDPPYFP